MKTTILVALTLFSFSAMAQRPATQAETAEDARVLKELSESMPHNFDGAMESERSFSSSNLSGLTGFHNNMNFATRDVFNHEYTATYEYTKAPTGLESKIEAAKAKNDLVYVVGASSCTIEIMVNSVPAPDNMHFAISNVKKINSPYCDQVYRDEAGREFTMMFFGKNWTLKPNSYVGTDPYGKDQTNYSIDARLKTHPGTEIQGIYVCLQGNADLVDIIMKNVNWQKIAALIGTGKITDATTQTTLKKYMVEKPVAPVVGENTLSFTYTDANGVEKLFSITSTKHDRSNCAILRNHNENPQVMESAHMDLYVDDDKDHARSFMLSLPIIRTTGSIDADFQSDYDYEVMWRGNTDANHSFNPENIHIVLSKWAPEGDFLEGTFSGTATIKDHNDFSTEKPKFTIKNGKFRIRRIKDEMK